MKKVLGVIVGIFSLFSLFAEEEHTPASQKENKSRKIESWISSGVLGTVEKTKLDTSLNGFFITDPAQKKTIALEYLGNLGSPAQSKIYFDRIRKSDFLFFSPYEIYYKSPEEIQYYNTYLPYTYLNYFNGGPSGRKEHRINGVFTVNVNSKFNVGIYGDWMNAYGVYASQSTKNYNAGLFASYMGKHHNIMANVSFNGYENYENGGLINTRDVTNPKETGNLEAQNMPVYFDDNVWSRLKNWNTYFNYKYHIGIDRTVQVTEDSVANVFIPVTSFIYTFQSESDQKKYYERNLNPAGGIRVDSFYKSYGLDTTLNVNQLSTNDSSRYWNIKQTFGIALNEEYNTLAHFGLTGYITADIKRYTYLNGKSSMTLERPDTLGFLINPDYEKETRYKIGFGASLAKHLGEAFTYNFFGEYYFINEKKESGSFNFGGEIQSIMNFGSQRIELNAQALYEQECPDFFEEYYFSNHIKWDENFKNKRKSSIKGNLSIPSFFFYPSLGISFMAGFENLENYIYWNEKALPEQMENNVQVFQFGIKQQIKLWYFHWDNNLVYQNSFGNDRVMPLPEWSWYSNFYFQYDKLFGVLTFQIGADMRYNTKYYAPCYMPATGQFYIQHEEQIGDYPYVNAYINCHLKRARFFVEYNHLNKGMGNDNYLVLPGYALNPSFFKFGVSANLSN